jgi:hypothetical protein
MVESDRQEHSGWHCLLLRATSRLYRLAKRRARPSCGHSQCTDTPPCKITPDYESGGQEFESLRARQLNQKLRMVLPIDPVGLRVHNQVHDRAGVRTRSLPATAVVIICTLRAVLPCTGLFLTFSPGVPAIDNSPAASAESAGALERG